MKNKTLIAMKRFDNLQQRLIELIADWLDSEEVDMEQRIEGFVDPVKREETDLHIRMAKAAMEEYKRTVKPTQWHLNNLK